MNASSVEREVPVVVASTPARSSVLDQPESSVNRPAKLPAERNWFGRVLCQPGTAGLVVGVGILLRLWFLMLFVRQPLVSDAAGYNNMSILLRRGQPFIPFWPPGLPLYLATVHQAFGESALVVRLAMLLFYVGCSLVLYKTSLALTGNVIAANLSLVFLAVSPAAMFASVETMTELPAAVFLIVIAYGLLRANGTSFGNAVLLGLSIGCLGMIRPSSLVLLPLVPLYLFWRTRKLAGPATVVILGALIVGSWVGYVYKQTGRFVQINTANAKNFYYGNNDSTPLYRTWWPPSHHEHENGLMQAVQARASDPISQDAEFSKLAADHIRRHPWLFVARTFNRMCSYFAFNMFVGAYLVENYGIRRVGFALLALDAALYLIVAVGAILYIGTLSSMNPRILNTGILLALALLYAFPYFVVYSHPRYHFPIEPILIVLASAFFADFTDPQCTVRRLVGQRRRALTVALTLFALVQLEFLLIVAKQQF